MIPVTEPSTEFIFEPFAPGKALVTSALTAIWNEACGSALAISERFVTYNTRPATGAVQTGQIVRQGDRTIGFVLASALPGDPLTSPPQVGWIDAIAVVPSARRQGLGTALLSWAEDWLRDHGCTRARLGGSLHPFVPGYPTGPGNDHFFLARGYQGRPGGSANVWDVARDLGDYVPLYPAPPDVRICTMDQGDQDALLAFLQREFPNRWRYEFQEFSREGGRPSDYMLLWTGRGIDGFARLTFEDSERPIDRFYLNSFPRPWGQLGPIGVSKDMRGRGYGGLLLDRSLLHLHERGIRGCVIDWTDLIGFYGKFGFKPYREYAMLAKGL